MASRVTNRGIVYWTNREEKILFDNVNQPIKVLRDLLPSRTDSAIYQRKLKVQKSLPKSFEDGTTIQRVYPVVENQSANSIAFEIHGISITINFQK